MAKPYKIPDFRKMYPEASEEVIAVLRSIRSYKSWSLNGYIKQF